MILDEVADKGPSFIPREERRKFFYQVTAHLVGADLVEGLRIARMRDYWGLHLLYAVSGAFSAVHSVPFGERYLHGLGQRAFQRQLDLAEKHKKLGYAVKIHNQADVQKAHEAHRVA